MKTQVISQKELVLQKLENDGYVDNFWAIKNHILRLGAVIYDIRNDADTKDLPLARALGTECGYRFAHLSPQQRKSQKKNWHYFDIDRAQMDNAGLLSFGGVYRQRDWK